MTSNAARLADAINGGGQIEALANPPQTVAEAYDLQDEVRAALGRPIVGWKLAHTTEKVQAAFGLDAPSVSPILDGMIVPAETVFPIGRFYAPELEAEVALELSGAIEGPLAKDELIARIGHMRLAIEVADTRLTDKAAVGMPSFIADLAGCGALVIGPRLDLANLQDAATGHVELRLGDGSIVPALATDMRPKPLDVLAFLARFATERGHVLPAGTIITTGTNTAPTLSGPGLFGVRFGEVGRVTARLSGPA
ncbi:MAG: fumarylacetoacetate hydrolase family protein [Pseudomonadota bacterium]